MTRLSYPAGGVFLAAFLAGPIFVASMLLGIYLASIPAVTPVGPEMLIALPGVFVTMPFGFFLGVVPCLVGSVLMTWASRFELVRAWPSWVLIGGAAPFAATYGLIGTSEGVMCFALTATGSVCALICRRFAEEQA